MPHSNRKFTIAISRCVSLSFKCRFLVVILCRCCFTKRGRLFSLPGSSLSNTCPLPLLKALHDCCAFAGPREKLIIVKCNLPKLVVSSSFSGPSRGMKRKYKPMGAAQSSGSTANKKFMSDTQPSNSQGDVSSFANIVCLPNTTFETRDSPPGSRVQVSPLF